MKNLDTPPPASMLTEIPFTLTIPDVSWYRNEKWEPGQFKRFRHMHTMCQDTTGFTFYNDERDLQELERNGQLDPEYRGRLAKGS
jgi:hypothetical protein